MAAATVVVAVADMPPWAAVVMRQWVVLAAALPAARTMRLGQDTPGAVASTLLVGTAELA